VENTNLDSTRFITDAIDYLYGLVFAGCCAALFFIVFFFVIESKDRTLEEIDRMYVERVNPIAERRSKQKESNNAEE
jgi:SP family sugar:H+ symporter-like MFS transporter